MDAHQILTLLFTVLTSGVVATVVTFHLNARREDRLFNRQRLEELHEAFFETSRRLSSYWLPFIAVMVNNITYNQALDMVNSQTDAQPVPVARMQMLASLYHPELLPLVDELLEIRDEANKVIHVHKERYKAVGPHQTNAASEMRSLSLKLTALEKALTTSLRKKH